MSHPIRYLAAAALAALAAAPAQAQRTAEDAADMKTLSAYRLSMPTVRKIAQAYENMLPLASDVALAREVAIEKSARGDNSSMSIADMEAFFGRHPAVRSAITRAGLSPREFAIANLSLMQAAMVVGFSDWAKEQGKPYDEAAAGAPLANVALVRANKAEIELVTAKLKAWEEAQKQAKRGDADSADDDDEDDDDEDEDDDKQPGKATPERSPVPTAHRS